MLSGSRDVACGTCHHHDLGTTDRVSLGLGTGATGLGPDRVAGERVESRIPRNAPGLWNLGAREVTVLFHDGRLSESDYYAAGFDSPAEETLPQGLDGILAAQALLPLTGRHEMAGAPGDNAVAHAARRRQVEAWALIASRVRAIPDYARALTAAYDLDRPEDITIVHIANAIGDFINAEWRSFDSPYDRHLRGEAGALTPRSAAAWSCSSGARGAAAAIPARC